MKKHLFFIIGILLITAQKAFCLTDALSSELKPALKTVSNEPSFLSILFSLLFVIALIYITGLIYSKLNIVGAKTVQNQIRNNDLSRAIVLSTTQLGQGKNLHVIEINNKGYLIGATPTSINLIKDLGVINKEMEEPKETSKVEVISDVEPEPETDIDKAIRVLYGKDEIEEKKEEKKFNLHKKYL